MTYLSATTIMIDVFGREAAPSMNPETDMALLARSGARSGGLVSWLGQTAIFKTLVARKAARDMDRAFDRLAKTSQHLLADIGLLDIPAIAERAPVQAKTETPAIELRAAPVPVALRPAQRPTIATAHRAPVAGEAKVPAGAARKEQPVAQ